MRVRTDLLAPSSAVRMPGILFFLMLGAALSAGAVQAQAPSRPLIDGLTVAPGVSAYIGDLDGNPHRKLIQYFASSKFSMMVAADRRFGNVSAALEVHYDRMQIDRIKFVLSNNIISLDLVGGYHFDIIRSDLFGLVGGVGLSLLVPHYERLPQDLEGVRPLGTRTVITFPVGLVIEDRVRLGVRVTMTDFLDGFEGEGGNVDLISFFHVGYRFTFTH